MLATTTLAVKRFGVIFPVAGNPAYNAGTINIAYLALSSGAVAGFTELGEESAAVAIAQHY